MGMTDYRKRLESLQGLMEEKGLDLIVYGASPDFQYLTGTNVEWRKHRDLNYPADSVFVPREGEPIIMAGLGNTGKIKECWIEDQRPLGMFEDLKPTVKRIMEELGYPETIGVGEYTWGSLVLAVANYSRGAKFRSAEGLLDKMRMIKDSYEIDKLRRVAKLTEAVMGKVIEEIDEEATMHNMNLKIEHLGRGLGATDVSFPTTAGFCKSGSEPVGVFNYEPDQPLEIGRGHRPGGTAEAAPVFGGGRPELREAGSGDDTRAASACTPGDVAGHRCRPDAAGRSRRTHAAIVLTGPRAPGALGHPRPGSTRARRDDLAQRSRRGRIDPAPAQGRLRQHRPGGPDRDPCRARPRGSQTARSGGTRAGQIRPRPESERPGGERTYVGLGVYYFQSPHEPAGPSKSAKPSPAKRKERTRP